MATRIRLQRMGRKKKPYYRIVVTDSRAGTSAGYIESLGNYRPIASGNDEELVLDQERVEHWLGCGAQPSDTVKDLFSKAGFNKD
ncbi:MAG: 30S ribosomal protein S16 [bacterium]